MWKTINGLRLSRTEVKPHHFYHITMGNWGNRVRLIPRSYSCYRASDEPDISRICVCPTIEGCINAVWPCYAGPYHKVSIYRTLRKVHSFKPKSVTDASITGERWLLKPTVFCLVGIIKGEDIYDKTLIGYTAGGEGTDLIKQANALRVLKNRRQDYVQFY